MTRHPHPLGLAFILLITLSGPLWAGVPTDQVRVSVDKVLKVVQNPELKKPANVERRRAQIRSIAKEIFNFEEIAQRSLAQHWAARTPKEREEFVALFSDLLERSYVGKIESYSGEKILYTEEKVEGEYAIVKSKLVTKQETEIPIDYKMRKVGSRWEVYDVAIEGVSLVNNYRTQFNKIILTSSYAELVKKMRTKQEELAVEEKSPTKKN